MSAEIDRSDTSFNSGEFTVSFRFASKTYEFFRLEPFERVLKGADKQTLLATAAKIVDEKTLRYIQRFVENLP